MANTDPNVGKSGEKAIVSMEDDLRWELPVLERRRVTAADGAVLAVLRQATPMFFVRLLESVEADKRQQQLVVCLVHLALEDVLRIQVHATLQHVPDNFHHYVRTMSYNTAHVEHNTRDLALAGSVSGLASTLGKYQAVYMIDRQIFYLPK